MAAHHTRSTPYPTHHTVGGAIVVTLQGEIDLLAVPALTARLDTLTAGPRPDLVLDLRPVSFMDCTGLGMLCRALRRARARHGRLRLVTDSARFLRTLRCTGLAGAFDIHSRWPDDLAGTPVAESVSAVDD
ncbi:STAS domain-containing protein [Streptomyces sp. NBC_01275]|uniref:STAS domain-containing protein n=1 Tax=Streptomyces sp. NBC_01275 TaxID=2903807 RepID=UPI002257778D|nr:STAS domain-containing protein [Streptomyces sp. NBC_01275]MCX4767959.1 STAS domain-containing protein [Streptomyces sp. NBC_01275]